MNVTSEASQSPALETYVSRTREWMLACFGEEITGDKTERCHRFLEEALELVQAMDVPKQDAHALIEYTYGRPKGEVHQEVGGVMVTLSALCGTQGLDMMREGETELARVWTKIEQIRKKQASKPHGSALPQPPDDDNYDSPSSRIEMASIVSAETQRSWKHRCYAIMGALGFDYGDPDWEMPDEIRKLEDARKKIDALEAELSVFKAGAVATNASTVKS